MKKRLMIYFENMSECCLIHDVFKKIAGKYIENIICVSQDKKDNHVSFSYFINHFDQWCDRSDIFGNEDNSNVFFEDQDDINIPMFVCLDCSSDKTKELKSVVVTAPNEQCLFRNVLSLAEGKSFYRYWIEKYSGCACEEPYIVMASDSLKNGFPFFYFGIFKYKRSFLIDYGVDDKVALVAQLLQDDTQTAECLVEFFKKKCDPSFLKDVLQLNYLLVEKTDQNLKKDVKVAIFVHLYYEDDFPLYLEYLSRVSGYCDIYISVDGRHKRDRILSLADSKLKSAVKIFLTENRGRDLSSLLVVFKPYILNYDYYCFLHDKHSHGNEFSSVGRAFARCLWDNLLPDSKAIYQIISIFESNPQLGLLVPPPPYWGGYLNIKPDMWTICYEKTVELARDLGINVKISNQINPVAIGTAFWCKKGALDVLYDHSWEYEDFDEEPLPIDGTKSHALERLLPYAALENGFLTGWILSNRLWPTVFESHVYLYENKLRSERTDAPIPYAVGKTSSEVGIKGAIHIWFQSFGLIFSCLVRFLKKHFK